MISHLVVPLVEFDVTFARVFVVQQRVRALYHH